MFTNWMLFILLSAASVCQILLTYKNNFVQIQTKISIYRTFSVFLRVIFIFSFKKPASHSWLQFTFIDKVSQPEAYYLFLFK